MSEIKKGDLVMVVRGNPCCGHQTGAEGMVFIADYVSVEGRDFLCDGCDRPLPGDWVSGCPGRMGIYAGRLTKIDPPAQDTTIDAGEPVRHLAEILK